MGSRSGGWHLPALCTVVALVLSGCGGSAIKADPEPKTPRTSSSQTPVAVRADLPAELREVALARPGAFKPPLRSADILVFGSKTLTPQVIASVKKLRSVVATEQFSMANFYAEEQPVVYAAVNPRTFRRFTSGSTATFQEIWDRIADGEIALTPELRKSLPLKNDYVTIGNDQGALRAHVGSYAELVLRSQIGALINDRWAAKLGMPVGNAMLISTGNRNPDAVVKAVRKRAGRGTSVQRLALGLGGNVQAAVLTGGSIARAVGSFTYTSNSNGSVNPDGRWVSQYIRNESVPILGSVTCNKAMLPQLRAALKEVVERGLSSKIIRAQYGGCYVPRFIASDPSKGLSFHTWGTAIDLNVPGNQRGTVGLIDREVVKIFIKWGFSWGGTWRYTDPMHFELARIVATR